MTELIGHHLVLNSLELSDCNETYLSWLNDPLVNQYLETRWQVQSIESILDFVKQQEQQKDTYLLAIRTKKENQHIGNIKLGPMNLHHHYADLSYFIGDRDHWGKGYATEAIQMMLQFGHQDCKLRTILAGIYENNIGSAKALIKSGFKNCGRIPHKFIGPMGPEDHILYSHTHLDFTPKS